MRGPTALAPFEQLPDVSVLGVTPTLRSLTFAQFRRDFDFLGAALSLFAVLAVFAENLSETMVVHWTKPAGAWITAGVDMEGDIFLELL